MNSLDYHSALFMLLAVFLILDLQFGFFYSIPVSRSVLNTSLHMDPNSASESRMLHADAASAILWPTILCSYLPEAHKCLLLLSRFPPTPSLPLGGPWRPIPAILKTIRSTSYNPESYELLHLPTTCTEHPSSTKQSFASTILRPTTS